MEDLPCKGCNGMCCGPVPVTEQELKIIKKKVKSMPKKSRMDLEKQPRNFGTCMFFDMEKDRCGIHSARPGVCRAFGYYKTLVCFRKPEMATKAHWSPADKPVGILSIDITWQTF